ncbi:MAG: ADP-ribosylglycohydrolase family protein, partial [Propionibacteriaceae bacterium]|nr:ADP-ribosylglycohydrolase family protein [Propionibacteriaceae bacterium]
GDAGDLALVSALQAAYAAVILGMRAEPGARVRTGLVAAVRAGHDTDTVAAIAGGALGALCGLAAIPPEWRSAVHGWPGLRADDLAALGTDTARGGLTG